MHVRVQHSAHRFGFWKKRYVCRLRTHTSLFVTSHESTSPVVRVRKPGTSQGSPAGTAFPALVRPFVRKSRVRKWEVGNRVKGRRVKKLGERARMQHGGDWARP